MSLRLDTSGILSGLDRHRLMVEYGLRQASAMEAKRLAVRAQADAPWTDRTGMARRGIHGTATPRGRGVRIAISGSVRYLVYLELAHGKRWAALWPAIEKHGREAVENIATFMRGIT